MVLIVATSVLAQTTPKQLFEAGRYEQVVQVVGSGREQGDGDTYLAAQSFVKLNQPDKAKNELARLREVETDAWALVSQSSIALIDGEDFDHVVARRAVDDEQAADFQCFYVRHVRNSPKCSGRIWTPRNACAFRLEKQNRAPR